MVKCPSCGSEVSKPYKTWKLKPYKDQETESLRNAERTIGLFACSNCGKKFRKVVATAKAKPS